MKKILLMLSAAIGCALSSQANLVFSDFFTYPDGGIVTNSTWVPNSGATPMLVSNAQLVVSTSRAEDIFHEINGRPYPTNGATTYLYSSFTLKMMQLPTAAGTYFAHFTGTNTFGLSGFRARIFAATTNSAAATNDTSGAFYLYIVNSNGGTSTNGNNQWLTPLATNTTYTVVTRLKLSDDTSSLWINPSAESDPSVADPFPAVDNPPVTPPQNGPVNIEGYSFRQASGEGTMFIDNLKIGTSFNDVAGPNTSPTISAIANINIPANSNTGPIAFEVTDAESPATALSVSGASGNTTLVPNGNITFGGSGTNRTVTVTPASGQQGVATITVSVSDGVNSSPTSFQVQVGAPTISAIADVMAYTNQTIPAAAFTIADPENDVLTLTATSSNPSLLPSSNVTFGGSGNNRTATLAPIAGVTGLATVTISVSDSHNTNSSTFALTVSPRLGLLFSDDFPYTNNIFSDPAVALYQADGSTWQSVSGTPYQITVTNGLAYLVATNTEDVGNDLSIVNTPASAVLVYTSFRTTFSFLPSVAGDYFVHLKSSGADTSNFRGKVFGCRVGAATNTFRIGISSGANTATPFPQDLTLGTTYTVVTRYNTATGKTRLWVNPLAEGSSSIDAPDAVSGTIGGIALRESSGMGDMTIANLKVGTSFSDVFTSTAPAPENLNIQVVGNNAVLTWTNPNFSLAASTDVNGAYNKIVGATSPYTNSLSGSTKFFRLVYP